MLKHTNHSKSPGKVKNADGWHCPEKYLFLWLFEGSKMSQNQDMPWKLPQIFMPDKHWFTKIFFACVGVSTTKADDALSHWCNQNFHRCAWDLKQARQQQESSLEKSQLCPQAPLFFAHLPVKASEQRLISNGIQPNPPSFSYTHLHVSAHSHTNRSASNTQTNRIMEYCSTFALKVKD